MKYIFSCLTILGLLIFLNYPVDAQDNKKLDDNSKYLADSIGLDNNRFSPGEPKIHFQEVMAAYMSKLTDLNTKTQSSIQLIGSIEFERMSDLSDESNIIAYRENLRQYKNIKKQHYDALDALMKSVNTKIGKDDLAKKRLGGSSAYYEEKLELFYLHDLDKYYEFLINNYDYFAFKGEEIFGTNDQAIEQYNAIREKMVTSADNINKIFDLKNNLLKDRMSEIKDWLEQN